MQEIAPHIYIETSYAGVTLGAIAWDHGLILIDSPFKGDDIRSWRASLLNMGSSADRLLVNLDAHVDRTLGVRAMDCTVVGHEEIAEAFRSRPLTFKAQSSETGAEWELYEGIGNTRWSPPEITFTQNLIIQWDDNPIIIEQWCGSAIGAITIRLPKEKIIFIGDIATPQQPPFLAEADLPAWIATLNRLAAPEFSNFVIISGRGGSIRQDGVRQQLDFLQKVKDRLDHLAGRRSTPETTEQLVPELLADFNIPHERKNQFQRRLQFGLKQYYLHHYLSSAAGSAGE
jgi:glyoxylase-like metal-dependent hydrolase (beta-lactamase superfamily II)